MGMASELKYRRRAAGLTQKELAGRLDVAQSNIAAYEKGSRPISAAMRMRIFDATAVRPSVLLERSQDQIGQHARLHGLTFLAVFGSCVRGTDTPGSDIDLLYDYAPGTSLFDIAEFVHDVEDLTGVSVDVTSVRSSWANRQMAEAVVLFDDRTHG